MIDPWRPASPRVDSQEHVFGLITSAHNQRASRKRVRVRQITLSEWVGADKRLQFEDGGASPRKRQRLASRLDAMIVESEDSDSFELTSEIVKLQMIAIGTYKEENRTLRAKVLELETTVKALQDVAGRSADREQDTTHELLRRRGNDLITHGEFLLSILEQHPAKGPGLGGTGTGLAWVPSAWLDLSEPACKMNGKAAAAAE